MPASASLPTLAAADGSARLAARVQGRPSATPSSAVAASDGDHRATRRHRRAMGARASGRCGSQSESAAAQLRPAAAQRPARPAARGADRHDPRVGSLACAAADLRPPARGRMRRPLVAALGAAWRDGGGMC